LTLKREDYLTKHQVKQKVEIYLENNTFIESLDFDEALDEMISENLIVKDNGRYILTDNGIRLSEKWKDLLNKREPILELIAGLTDGTITGLVIVISAFIAQLSTHITTWAAMLSLASVATTNFSSFMLGGKTEDIADALSIEDLMKYSVSDISDKVERRKSLNLIKHLFSILKQESTRTNFFSAATCGVMTFLAGITPVAAFLTLPPPLNVLFSFLMAGAVTLFLIRYRSEKSKVRWKVTVLETLLVMTIAIIASLLIGIF
jgi:hypothetical protein